MLKRIIEWFTCFGLSYLVADVFKWTDQGRAFMYINLGFSIAFIVIVSLIFLFAGIAIREKLAMAGVSVLLIVIAAAAVAVSLFATWCATKLFNVDFFITYQIMTFGACLATSVKVRKKEPDYREY